LTYLESQKSYGPDKLADFGFPFQALCFFKFQKLFWLSSLFILSVPDEGYSRNMPCTLNLISTFLNKNVDIKFSAPDTFPE
jgi:hypothetical protein